jgi:hypothetical protein
MDILFYSTLILLAWFLVTYSVHLMRQKNRRIP